MIADILNAFEGIITLMTYVHSPEISRMEALLYLHTTLVNRVALIACSIPSLTSVCVSFIAHFLSLASWLNFSHRSLLLPH